jgi:putative ABC transport system permease protein
MPWITRLWNALRPGRLERDIAREVTFHIAEKTDDLRAAGLRGDEAQRRARAAFGNPSVHAEGTRDVDVAQRVDAFLRDLRYAGRTLARTPAFTLAVVTTLALAIGANVTVFSVLDTVLLRPLPFPDPDRLVRVAQTQQRSSETLIAPPRLEDWNAQNTAFDGITGYYVEDTSDTTGEFPERVKRAFVTPRFLDVWRIAPLIGRGFSADEHRFGGPSAIIVSERYWRHRLGGDPSVLQRTVRLGSAAIPIIGVMPASFQFPDREVELWSASRVDAPYAQSRESTWYYGIGRLRPDVTPAQARENLRNIQAQLGERHPTTDRDVSADVVPLKDSTTAGVGPSLWLLFAAVTVLLLIACTNIAALLLSRAAQRRQEIAVRMSLGASRSAVAAQLMTETAVLATAGGLSGLAVAVAASGLFRTAAADLPRIDALAIDGRIVVYTLVCTSLVALVCGLLPAFQMSASGAAVRGSSRAQVSLRNPLQWTLVAAQVALSVTLLAGAGLLIRSFHELSRVDPGFDTSRILTFRLSGSWSETSDQGRLTQRIRTTTDSLGTIPGIESVATAGWSLPGVPEQWETTFELVEGRPADAPPIIAEGRAVSPEYFATLGIPVLAGEVCRHAGTGATQAIREVVVNRTFAARYLDGRPGVIGLHLRDANDASAPSRIAGVVGDARERGLDQPPGPTVYWCAGSQSPSPYFLLRTHGSPHAAGTDVRIKMKEIEPLRSVYELAPLDEKIGDAFAENRLRAALLALFAAAALSLSAIGLYGTLSYAVSARRREVGLRLALGATRGRILAGFMRQALQVVGVACVAGIGLALASNRLIAGMLFGVSPSDWPTLGAVVVAVVCVATLAVLVPSLRAALVQPMQVLRE